MENKTYNLSTVVKQARKGLLGNNNLAQNNHQENKIEDNSLNKNSLTDSKFWKTDFAHTSAGLCQHLESNMTMGTNQATDVLFIALNPNLTSFVPIHDPKLFYFTSNPELPFNAMTVNTMKMHSF